MKKIMFAEYKRESTLWKNANAFYVAQDWTTMKCYFEDYTQERKENKEMGITIINKETGEDVTEKHFRDRYIIELINRRETNSKYFSFDIKEEANNFFKNVIMKDKYIKDWKRVK